MGTEDVKSLPTTPITRRTPVSSPLFGGQFKPERGAGGRKSFLKSCKCFSVEALSLEEGTLPSVSCALTPPPISLARKVGAEFIGTLILIFTGTATATVNQKTQGSETLLGLAASFGLAVMIVPVYIGAQILASLCASFLLKAIFDPIMGGGVTVPSGVFAQAFALEFIISFNLMFVVIAVATDTRASCNRTPKCFNENRRDGPKMRPMCEVKVSFRVTLLVAMSIEVGYLGPRE
ncbi:Aquaporin NIP6-1 [Forsythia ovata]|uniref:Aquaporin NIP6-1 n=1 Tax=Forsythia ovata TaxID=205694 RepID=A0ABD1PI01_9LAMI